MLYNGRVDLKVAVVLNNNEQYGGITTVYNGTGQVPNVPFMVMIKSVDIEDIDVLEKVQLEKEIARLNNELAKLNRAYQNLEYRHQEARKQLCDRDEAVLDRINIEPIVNRFLKHLNLGDAINTLVDAYMREGN